MKWDKRSKLLKISSYAIIICLILTVVLAGFTIYGNKVGNFVISVDKKKNISLALSEQPDRSAETARLAAKAVENQTLASLSDVPRNIAAGMGSKNEDTYSPHYLAFSFYLINHSERMIDYQIEINIIELEGNVDDVVRVMLIENDGERGTVYAKPRADGTPEDHSDPDAMVKGTEPYSTVAFLSDTRVCSRTVTNFEKEAYIKYTLVLWMEGEDEQATNDVQGSKIRMSLTFTGQ